MRLHVSTLSKAGIKQTCQFSFQFKVMHTQRQVLYLLLVNYLPSKKNVLYLHKLINKLDSHITFLCMTHYFAALSEQALW